MGYVIPGLQFKSSILLGNRSILLSNTHQTQSPFFFYQNATYPLISVEYHHDFIHQLIFFEL